MRLNGREPQVSTTSGREVFLGGERGRLHLIELLNDDNASIREEALFQLAEAGDERVLGSLLLLLDNRKNSTQLRARAAFAIRSISTDNAMLALIERLSEPYWYVRWHITQSLGFIGDYRAVGPLVDILTNDHSSFARQNAALALGQIRHYRAVPALTNALSDNRAIVREAAVTALTQIGTPEANQAVLNMRQEFDV